MEQKNNLILQGTETFSRGALDNVALDNGCLVLDSSDSQELNTSIKSNRLIVSGDL